MPIHSIIREKRKELGLTQEQIADYLGVSAPAVNKWEKGANYPDISLLPALARLFKIDMNTLLCFNDELSQQEIDHFTLELAEAVQKDGFARGFALGLEKVREYPSCGQLIHTTATVLDGSLIMSDLNPDEKKDYKDQITGLYERAYQTAEGSIRDRSAFMLSSRYMQNGDYAKAQELLDALPEQGVDKRQLQASLFIQKNQLPEAAGLFDLWDYSACSVAFNVALVQKNVAKSLELLKLQLKAVETPWNPTASPLYRHAFADSGRSQDSLNRQKEYILPPLLSVFETDPQFEFLQSTEEFRQLLRLYRGKC